MAREQAGDSSWIATASLDTPVPVKMHVAILEGPADRNTSQGKMGAEESGPAWEDIIVRHFGEFWRDMRDRSNRIAWIELRDDFVSRACADAHVPLEGYKPRDSSTDLAEHVSKKRRLEFSGAQPEANELQETPAALLRWSSWEKRFLFICDSELLVDAVCGRAVLEEELYEPVLERIVCAIAGFFENGWRPPTDWEDPVVWMRRSHNKVADGLADWTMDHATTWEREYPTTIDITHANVIIQTDGGRRSSMCAAASVVAGVLSIRQGKLIYEPFYARGTFISHDVTVLQTEAIALDEATRYVRSRISI